jgi:hypothetical protein
LIITANLLYFACFITFEGKIYDPADIAIINKFNGVELKDVPNGILVPEHYVGRQ